MQYALFLHCRLVIKSLLSRKDGTWLLSVVPCKNHCRLEESTSKLPLCLYTTFYAMPGYFSFLLLDCREVCCSGDILGRFEQSHISHLQIKSHRLTMRTVNSKKNNWQKLSIPYGLKTRVTCAKGVEAYRFVTHVYHNSQCVHIFCSDYCYVDQCGCGCVVLMAVEQVTVRPRGKETVDLYHAISKASIILFTLIEIPRTI